MPQSIFRNTFSGVFDKKRSVAGFFFGISECNRTLSTRAVLQVKEDALKTFAESHEVTLEEFQRKSFLVRTFMGALKLFAPLL